MKKVDNLLRKAKSLLTVVVSVFLAGNDDCFLEALGLDPEKYRRVMPDGTDGYDFMAALKDTATLDWAGDEDDEIYSISLQDSDIGVFKEQISSKLQEPEQIIQNEPWKFPGWNALSHEEKREILRDIGKTERDIPEETEQEQKKPKPKNKDMFGWG